MLLVGFSKILLTGCQNILLLQIVFIFTWVIKNSLHFSYGTQKLFIQGREFNLMQQNQPPADKVKRQPCKIEMTERFKAHEGINYEYPNSKALWLYKVCSFIWCPLVFATAKVIKLLKIATSPKDKSQPKLNWKPWYNLIKFELV